MIKSAKLMLTYEGSRIFQIEFEVMVGNSSRNEDLIKAAFEVK